ncbi:MAG: hypothetical protein KC517_09260 [Bacteroidetes bacterium]|nr:hypothetical protein [Bacteroidota bacterium]
MAVHKTDTVRIGINIGSDISGASVTQIKYKTPAGDTGVWTATIGSTDTTVDGVVYVANQWIYYDAVTATFDETGYWTFQSYLELPTDRAFHGDKVTKFINPYIVVV